MPYLRLALVNKQKKFEPESIRLLCERAASATLEHLASLNPDLAAGADTFSLCISLVSEAAIRDLNQRFRAKDQVTDILSFPMFEFQAGKAARAIEAYDLTDPTGQEKELFLGDLVICPVRAAEQAERFAHTWEREMAFLTVHGMLHLFGFDHMEEDEEKRMRTLQREIMDRLGLGIADTAGGPEREVPGRKAGFIALVGRPNVGKSTFLNYVMGSKLAITSPKPQTTRTLIRGVLNDGDSQLVFLDSPGIHAEKHALDRYMSKAISVAVSEADIILLLIEAGFKPRVDSLEMRVARRAKENGKPLLLLINKCDIAKKANILPLIDVFAREMSPSAIIPVSARTGEGTDAVLEEIKQFLPQRDFIFSEEDYTDQTEAILTRELIRLELLRQLDDEIPHGTAVLLESFEEELKTDEHSGEEVRVKVRINACIVCERENHKGMILGKAGKKIQSIGTLARKRIAEMLDCPCELFLFVKVEEKWRQRPQMLRDLGYDRREPVE